MSITRRHKRIPTPGTGLGVVDFLKRQLTNPDKRSHAQFLAEMRTKQGAGQLANPATAALLDRLERAIH
jgi:hypothetical protein